MSNKTLKGKAKNSLLLVTPEPGTVAVYESFPGWLTLKVYWDKFTGSKTNGQLFARTASGVRSYGVTDTIAARPLMIYGNDLIWTFNTTKGLNARTTDGDNVNALSSGDKVMISHLRHIRGQKIYLSPEEIVLIS